LDFEDLYHDEPLEAQKPAPERPRIVQTVQEIWAGTISRVVLGLVLFTAFVAGAWVAGTAFHDPDTCWLLALGRWIFEHGAIPDIDPFSWTFVAEEAKGRHFILYQWLTELIFYLSTRTGGLLTLLMLTAVTVVTAFISLPIGYVVKREAPFLAGLLVVFVGLMAGSFHFLCRPEIFSYLFTAIFLQVLHYARVAAAMENEKLFRIAFVLTPLMVLWANLHTGFVTGISLIGGCLLGAMLGHLFIRESVSSAPGDVTGNSASGYSRLKNKALIVELSLALLGTTLATLITPYGLKLWAYIPDLFGSPINKYIVELRPLSAAAMREVTYWPYLALCLALVLLTVREILALKKPHSVPPAISRAFIKGEILIVAVNGTIAMICGFSGRRLIVFTALIIVAEILALLGLRRLGSLERVTAEVAAASRASAEAVAKMIALAEAIEAKNSAGQRSTHVEIDDLNALSDNGLGLDEAASSSSAPASSAQITMTKRNFWQDVDIHSLDVWLTGGTFELAIVSLCAIAGVCLVTTRVTPPSLPSSGVAFQAPFAAIDFIEKHRDQLPERLFNDAQFGDMIIWQLRALPKVFVDTRFDMYGGKIVGDYRIINDCLPDWRPLFESYKIGWVFAQPGAKIVQALKADPNWQVLYQDSASVILIRKAAARPALLTLPVP